MIGGYFGLAARPYLGYDVVKLDLCEVLVHLLQDLTEPQHWNEPLSFTVKEPENELFDAFLGKTFNHLKACFSAS